MDEAPILALFPRQIEALEPAFAAGCGLILIFLNAESSQLVEPAFSTTLTRPELPDPHTTVTLFVPAPDIIVPPWTVQL